MIKHAEKHLRKKSAEDSKLKNASMNMVEGPLFKKIIVYTVPIIFSGVLQLLFNATDLIVVGHFCGELALGAVGATGSLINLMINVFIGLSVGSGIVVARALGAGRNEDVQKAVHTTIPLALISGLTLTAIGVPLSGVFLRLMGTPDTVIGLSTTYMQIYFSGTVFSMLYNFGSAILRATGDTQRPLMYLVIAGTANVGLNIIFITAFGMSVDGVALATMISHAISASLVLLNLMKRTDVCQFKIRKMKIDAASLKNIISIGVPSGVASSFFSISNVIIQSSVNLFGDIALSGISAANSVEGFVYTSMNSFMHTTQNFVSQNYGAHKFDRIKKTVTITVNDCCNRRNYSRCRCISSRNTAPINLYKGFSSGNRVWSYQASIRLCVLFPLRNNGEPCRCDARPWCIAHTYYYIPYRCLYLQNSVDMHYLPDTRISHS